MIYVSDACLPKIVAIALAKGGSFYDFNNLILNMIKQRIARSDRHRVISETSHPLRLLI